MMASEQDILAGSLDAHAVVMADAAHRRGIDYDIVLGTSWPMSRPKRPWLRLSVGACVFYYRLGRILRAGRDGDLGRHVNGSAATLTRNKQRTKEVLVRAGYPTPPGRLFRIDALDQALLYAAECRGEICVKPNRGGKGDLVFPMLRDADAIYRACLDVAEGYEELLVEASVPGEVWRYFYVHPRVVAVKHSRPASVVGDGGTTVLGLIDGKNAERERRRVIGHFPIPSGPALTAMLARQGLTLESVVPAERLVFLNAASNGALGADSITCVEGGPHPLYVQRIEAACHAIPNLLVGAIDTVIRNPEQPPSDGNFWILEINSSPGVLPYHFPWEGAAQDICGEIIALLECLAAA